MNSEYYSSHNRERLEKERVGRKQSYEDLCLEVCNKYISDSDCDNMECKELTLKILRILEAK